MLSGATTMFPGYASRIEEETKRIYTEKNLQNAKTKEIKIKINIIDSPRRKFSVFIGACVLGKTYNESQVDYWISKKDWDECGPDIVLKKCQNIIK